MSNRHDGGDWTPGIRLLDASQAVAPAVPGEAPQRFGRSPCDEPGLPVTGRHTARPLTPEEILHLDSQAEQEQDQAQPGMAPTDSLGIVWGALWSVTTGLLILGSLAFLLFVVAQLVQTLAALAQSPLWLRLPGYAGLVALGAIALFYIARLGVLYFKLRRSEPLSLTAIHVLDQRRSSRQLARERRQEAVSRLRNYIRVYPLADSNHRRFLVSCGLEARDVDELQRAADFLLSDEDRSTWESWISDFKGRFQGVLDRAAMQQIKLMAKLVGIKSAISPNPLIDSAVVVYSGFAMLGALCQIYNVRLGPLGMLRLAGWVFSQAYLAGRLEELPIEDWFAEAVSAGVGRAIGSVAAPSAQGVANGWLIYRLGRHASRLLRPVSLE